MARSSLSGTLLRRQAPWPSSLALLFVLPPRGSPHSRTPQLGTIRLSACHDPIFIHGFAVDAGGLPITASLFLRGCSRPVARPQVRHRRGGLPPPHLHPRALHTPCGSSDSPAQLHRGRPFLRAALSPPCPRRNLLLGCCSHEQTTPRRHCGVVGPRPP